jgi:hypothetical protein
VLNTAECICHDGESVALYVAEVPPAIAAPSRPTLTGDPSGDRAANLTSYADAGFSVSPGCDTWNDVPLPVRDTRMANWLSYPGLSCVTSPPPLSSHSQESSPLSNVPFRIKPDTPDESSTATVVETVVFPRLFCRVRVNVRVTGTDTRMDPLGSTGPIPLLMEADVAPRDVQVS